MNAGLTSPAPESRLKRYRRRLAALKTERANGWDAHWKDLSEQILPRRSRFFGSEANAGTKKNGNIINNTPTHSARVIAAGMMTYLTSPARPWFRLTTPDPEMAEAGEVRAWLHWTEERMRQVFLRSNIYNALATFYLDLPTFSTACMYVDEDAETVIRAYVLPAGSYYLAASGRLVIDTLYRELKMTVRQLVERFGRERCSDAVRLLHAQDKPDEKVGVVHMVEPNADIEPGRADARGMAWRSCWYEEAEGPEERYLQERGYHESPVLAARWGVTGEDVYGSDGPGMDALGDCRALQLLEKRKAQVIDKVVTPPMKAPSSLRNGRVTLLPGDTTYVDVPAGGQAFEPAFLIHPQALEYVEASIRQHEGRIGRTFFVDLFLMLANSDRREITAEEIRARHEEKLQQLGPVLERLNAELFDPLIDRSFGIMLRRGMLPPPPEELQGVDLRVEYLSPLSQAQRLLNVHGVERLVAFINGLAQGQAAAGLPPDALDKFNVDEAIDEYASAVGTKPDLVRSDEEVAELRAARAQQQQAAQQGAAMAAAAKGAKDLAGASLEEDNALSRMLGPLAGGRAAA